MRVFRALSLAVMMLVSGLALAAPVNINTADASALQGLDGVGPAKAAAIVDYRDANGPFSSVEDLTAVDGIGEKTVEANRESIVVQ
ncbi:helix-hairpin-helix domain-containing protein [Ectothiorhodospiraceae bacterium WFHF3C12]|nr:helix-hairpin-helix domain-containing protein [Ectothiorhodospiraceae bacterium WFHF3C12]